jgi:SnoaL-like domain
MPTYTKEELDAAFIRYWRTGAVGEEWDAWADLFTADARYVEHVLGTMRGREAIRAWIKPIMAQYGEVYTAYEWHMVDPTSGRICVYMQNRRDHPGGTGVIDFPGITVLHYAGGGRFDYEEDLWSVPGATQSTEIYEAARKEHDRDHRTKMTRLDWGGGPEWTRGGPSYAARRPIADLPPLP